MKTTKQQTATLFSDLFANIAEAQHNANDKQKILKLCLSNIEGLVFDLYAIIQKGE